MRFSMPEHLSDEERIALLRKFDQLIPRIEPRSPEDVDRELAEIRRARGAGRATSSENSVPNRTL